jgi:hypothetical protein
MRKYGYLTIAILIAVAAAGAASAQMTRFRALGTGNLVAHLSGAQEVPPVDARGQGQAVFSVSDDRSVVNYKLLVANTENMTASHIHCGAPGVNGPVVVFLFGTVPDGETLNGILAQGSFKQEKLIPRPDSAACPGGVATLEQLLAKMEAGDAYVNVHTLAHPGGEIRGQIKPPEM